MPLDPDPLWYKDAVVYELHVRAFFDSNGDGIGDFKGLIQKLDYLEDLGVTALWLLPFYPSPLRDDGYDIADYTDINPIYGSLADFKQFLREAHRRGLRVINELVLNHTSDQHAWFQQARRAAPGSRRRDFYVWGDNPDRYPEARIIFKDFEPSNWTWDPVAKAFYWHRFFAHQPDLNFDNPAVHRAVLGALDFWMNLGVDGCRLDAVPYLYEREGTNCENLPETHAFLRELRRHLDGRYPARMLLAEANQWPEDSAAYFGRGDECHMAFHFPVMPRLFMGIRMEDRFPIVDILRQTPPIPDNCQWALFLRNHDELTLEMVTDEDRDYMYRVYAQDRQARINLGIRRRLAPLLENNRAKVELMNGLLFSLPGTPVLYYGDEIGMGDNIYLGDRNGVRTPMQWSAERNAGFSRANPQKLYSPVVIDPHYHYEAVNVEAQQGNPHSLLWWMKNLIALRKRTRAFGRGSLEFLYPDNAKVLAFVRRYTPHPQPLSPSAGRGEQAGLPSPPSGERGRGEGDVPLAPASGERGWGEGEEIILVVANLSRVPQYCELDLSAFPDRVPVEMLGHTRFPPTGPKPYFLTLGPYAFYWFRLEPRPVPQVAAPGPRYVTLAVQGSWENVFARPAREALEEALPAYLQNCPWFAGKCRQAEAAMVVETLPVPFGGATAHVALIQVEYTEGDPETYVLPLAFTGRDDPPPAGALARLTVRQPSGEAEGTAQGFLYDPTGEKAFAETLLDAVARGRRYRRSGGELAALALRDGRPLKSLAPLAAEAVTLNADHQNSVLFFDERWVMKLFRRVEEGVQPELEVGRFLAEKTSFTQVPPLAGALEYRRSWGEPLTLAVVQGYVPHQGSAWDHALGALGRYFEQLATRRPTPQDLTLPAAPLGLPGAEGPPPLARELLGSFLESARLLGQRTGELHVALASSADDPNFRPEPFTPFDQRSRYQAARTATLQVLDQLRKRLGDFPEGIQAQARQVLDLDQELLRRFRAILELKSTARRIRCHGDYHLGQLLFTGKDFVILDFEGDSTRSLNDRRLKRVPLTDVADMIRSFHYAALFALQGGGPRPSDLPALEAGIPYWHRWATATFLQAYLGAAARGDFLPRDPSELSVQLDFHLLKRALGELRHELQRRPDRVHVPLRGLLNLLHSGV